MLEKDFQSKLKQELKERFPGAIVLKTDPNYIQGFPDLLMLWKDRWASLECKREKDAHKQPNQEFYVDLLNQMSFAAFIEPSNKGKVLDDLERTLKS